MKKVYGYCRVSTQKQSLERQIANIKAEEPNAVIFAEKFTGTTTDRPEWQKLLRIVKEGDTIIFDEVSRMSRNAEEGFETYTELFDKGIELIFLKERHIDTQVYKKALETEIDSVGNEIADTLIEAVNKVLRIVQRQQIETAFETAQKEVDFLHSRISEGITKAKAKGQQIGRATGTRIETKKAKEAKAVIRKHSKDFGGSLTDQECIRQCGISRNSFYKYKAELRREG